MTSLRESPIKRRPPRRPIWVLVVVIGVAALVVIGIVYALLNVLRGSSDSAASGGPAPCATTMVTPAQSLPAPRKVRVNVYNATQVAGLAGKTAKELGARDFTVVKVANDPRNKQIAGVARIRFGAKGERSAQVLLFQVPGAELVNDGRRGRSVDLAMGESFAGLAPVDVVASAMAVATPSVSGISCPTDSAGATAPLS